MLKRFDSVKLRLGPTIIKIDGGDVVVTNARHNEILKKAHEVLAYIFKKFCIGK